MLFRSAPPHAFAVNVPQAMAVLRGQTYHDYAWPRAAGALYKRNGLVLSLALGTGLALFLALAVLLSFALAFLVYEFLRKTAWPSVARPGERLYSQALGPWGAILALVCCALGATLLLFALLLGAGWNLSWAAGASLPALLPVIQALTRFLTRRDQRVRLAGQGMAFLLLFYGLPCLLALASGSGLNVPGSPVAGLR